MILFPVMEFSNLIDWLAGDVPTPSPLREEEARREEPTTSSNTSECFLGKEGEECVYFRIMSGY